MIKVTIMLMLVSLIWTGHAKAEVIEVSLPGLIGYYAPGTMRSSSFDLGSPVQAVHSVSIYWSGNLTSGLGHGDGVCRSVDDWFQWPTWINAIMDEPEQGCWFASVGPLNGYFADNTKFEPFLNPSWDFLLDGVGEVSVRLSPAIIICATMVTPPRGFIESAVLMCDVDRDHSQVVTRGTVNGPLWCDPCGDFLIQAEPGFQDKLVDVNCSVGDWSYWMSLVDKRIEAWGMDKYAEGCDCDGLGESVFCVNLVDQVATRRSTWSAIKVLYKSSL